MQAPAPAPQAAAPTGDVETLIKGISQGLAKLTESLLGSEAPEELKAQATVAAQEVSKLMQMLEGGAAQEVAPTGNTTVEAGAREVEPVL